MTAPTCHLTDNTLYCTGMWTVTDLADLEGILCHLAPPPELLIDGQQVTQLDLSGAWLLTRWGQHWQQAGCHITWQGFQQEQQQLLELAATHAAAVQPLPPSPRFSLVETIGYHTVEQLGQLLGFISFIGEIALTLGRVILQPQRIRWQALFATLYSSGVTALPIVGLLAFLIGVVLAYQGGMQLRNYGANIFIVDLVGITLLRELAPLLTAIIVAGRSGSAYTAQIGTMRITEEIDALRTLGISPLELLVLPKLFALIIVLPLLCAYADVMSVIGSMLVAKFSLGVSSYEFLDRFPQAVPITHYLIGISKAPIFAAIIALVGCYQGLQVRGGADSVGEQVTISVVRAIFLVIIVDAVFSIVFSWLGI
jgi:phospholipid/cholesterol/gamma-HCH transport system permease protein